jgi:hypothetical protein
MKIPQAPGVYCLKAMDSKLIYIGSTNNLYKRKSVHLSQIKMSNVEKGCKSMIDAYNSGDFVIFELIELCDNYLEREQYWLDFYKGQDTYELVNRFDADRNNSSTTQHFRDRMSQVLTKRWEDPVYKVAQLKAGEDTRFTPERLNKPVLQLLVTGTLVEEFPSAKKAAELSGYSSISISAAARGDYRGSFKYKGTIYIYKQLVLDKLDELLETHQELRAISSEAWEAIKSTMNVQRLTSEHSSNNLDTSVQQLQLRDIVIDDIV